MTSILLGAGRQARPCAACLHLNSTTIKPSSSLLVDLAHPQPQQAWSRHTASMARRKVAGRTWEEMAADRKKNSKLAWNKRVEKLQQIRLQGKEEELKKRNRERKEAKMVLEEKWGPSMSHVGDSLGSIYTMPSLISPGIIPAEDLKLSDEWEGVPSRLGKCIHFGCTKKEQVRLMASISRMWGERWADVLAGLNHTVLDLDWKPPPEWIQDRGDKYLPKIVDFDSYKSLDWEFTDDVPYQGEAAPPISPVIKYHLWGKPFLPMSRYKGDRWPHVKEFELKPLAPGAVENLIWYKNRWIRTWLPHSAGVKGRSPPSKLRAMCLTPETMRPMTYRLSSSILVDASWGKLYENLPADIDDHLAWDRLARHIQSLQKEWADSSPDLAGKVNTPNQMPFLSLSVVYSMQDQRIIARALHENPSVNDAPPTKDPRRFYLARWHYTLAQLVITRQTLTCGGGRDEAPSRRPWQNDPRMFQAVMDLLDQAIPKMQKTLAELENQPEDTWYPDGNHRALRPVLRILAENPATRLMLTNLGKKSQDWWFTANDLSYRYSVKYQRLRMQSVARRVLDRLATQEEATDWARQMAGTTLKELATLEDMTWKRPGATEAMGLTE